MANIDKIILFILVQVILFSWMLNAQAHEIKGKQDFHIGVSSRALGSINQNDTAAALKIWGEALSKEQGFGSGIDIKLLSYSAEEIRNAFLLNNLDGVSVTVDEYMSIGIEPDEVFAFVGSDVGNLEIRYVLITGNRQNIETPNDLVKSKTIVVDDQIMVMSIPWLETLFAETDSGKQRVKFKYPVLEKKQSRAIFQVFFNQADAAVVTSDAFELACELNPQLRDNLKILAESPPFITTVLVFRPSLKDGRDMSKLEKAILNIHNTPAGQQLMTVIRSSRMEKYPASVLNTTIDFLRRHKALVKGSIFKEPLK